MYQRITLLCVLLMLMIPGEAPAVTICWMARVVTDSQGVRVVFESFHDMTLIGEVVTANKAAPPRRFRVEAGQVHWENGATEPSLLLKPAEWAPLIAAVETPAESALMNNWVIAECLPRRVSLHLASS
jgi:hypothetical protein